jgi:hypothetical protein
VKKAGKELLMQSVMEDLSDWHYEPKIVDAPAFEVVTAASPTDWIVFGDKSVSELVSQQLVGAGDKVTTVKYSESYSRSGNTITLRPSAAEGYGA